MFVYSQTCATITQFQKIIFVSKLILHSVAVTSVLFPQPLADHWSMFCLYRLRILYILYKWNHLISDLWSFFTPHHVSKVQPCYSMCQNLVPFCCSIIFQCVFVWVHTFCLLIHWLLDIWVLPTFLVTINNTAINMHVLVFVWTYVLVL